MIRLICFVQEKAKLNVGRDFAIKKMEQVGGFAEAPPVADEARRIRRSGRKNQAPTDAPIFSGTARGQESNPFDSASCKKKRK
ncbi:MAG: hypothetical protein J6B54_01890 [Clostridia bacterium]|nr:hypothetical protein [Clostridia bacterium]